MMVRVPRHGAEAHSGQGEPWGALWGEALPGPMHVMAEEAPVLSGAARLQL